MLIYQLRLALKSIRRNPILSLVCVLGIGLGISVSMTFVAAYYVISGDPIPHKSDKLYYVQLDSWNPDRPWDDDDPSEAPDQLTYIDALAMMENDIATHQTAMYKTMMVVHPPSGAGRPQRSEVRHAFADFFALFDVPFRYGGPWTDAADAGPEPVVVLTAEENDRLFGGEDSVGKTLQIENRDFRVVGVLDPWRPVPKYYDPHNGEFGGSAELFMPFHWGTEMRIRTTGNTSSWKSYDGYDGLLQSEAVWLQMWVQLDDAEQKGRYMAFLDGYADGQRAAGRFQRPNNNKLRDVNQWLEHWGIIAPENKAMVIISLLFLLICAVNLVGILLGKFLSRAAEVGVRRALGASRGWVFTQHLLECGVIGVAGGMLGLGLSVGGLRFIEKLFQIELGPALDGTMLAVATGLALLAALIAGLYPAWRICRIAPGMHLKTQ